MGTFLPFVIGVRELCRSGLARWAPWTMTSYSSLAGVHALATLATRWNPPDSRPCGAHDSITGTLMREGACTSASTAEGLFQPREAQSSQASGPSTALK